MVIHRLQSLYSMASSSAHDFFFQEANTISFVHSLISRAWRHLDVTHVPLVIQALLAMCWLKKWMLTSIECVFLDFWDARGLGLLFVVCACAVGLRGNRLTGMRGTWGVVWRSAHVPMIPFTWLRRANAWALTTHASNYQALLSIKLCKECGFNSCVRVFFIPMGHVDKTTRLWRQFGHMGEMRDSDWSRPNLLRSDWLPIFVAIITTIDNSCLSFVLCPVIFCLYLTNHMLLCNVQ